LIQDHLFAVTGFMLALVLAVRVLQAKRPTGSTVAWLLAIVLVPYLGVPLYLLLGDRKLDRFIQMKGQLYAGGEDAKEEPEDDRSVVRIATTAGLPAPRPCNYVSFHTSGETAYDTMMRMFESAQKCIHVSTFILGRDEVGRAVVEVLSRKAREGVEVRLLLDGLGCLTTSGRFVRPLRKAGGQVGRFLPVLPLQHKWSANLRNHRKIVVVDHAVAMVGGMNLGTLFMGPSPHPKRYIDASVFLCGPAVEDIETVFFDDWNYATDEVMDSESVRAHGPYCGYAPEMLIPEPSGSIMTDCEIQTIPSGPDIPGDTFHDALLTAIMDARKRIWLVTPYFVPDDSLLKALALKARSGCNVSVLVPMRSDHRIVDWARGPALRKLAAAGATLYSAPRTMVHAKVMLFDDTLAITGSANLDMRSIYLNFEIALFHYTDTDIQKIEGYIRSLQRSAHYIRPDMVSRSRAWVENFCRLLSPLL
jgi:cardiolipin synthase